MASTLDDLIDRVRHKLALPDSDQMVPDADLTISINDGLNASATDYDWPWLFVGVNINTVAGTSAYALPAGHVRTLWIANAARAQDLKAIQRRELTEYVLQTGIPRFYSVYGAAVRFVPVPDGVYVLSHTYVRNEPALVTGTDVPLCPDYFSEIIVLYAAAEEATRLKDFSQRNAFLQDIGAWKARMRDNVRQEASTLKIRARHDWSVG